MQDLLRIKIRQRGLLRLHDLTKPNGLYDILLFPLQRDQMTAHAVRDSCVSALHHADLFQRQSQLAQQLDLF